MKKLKNTAEKRIMKEHTRSDAGADYIYRLYENTPKRIGRMELTLYSVYIRMKKDGMNYENILDGVFADVGKALTFYNSLVENLASPIDLNYVFEDRLTV